MAEINYWKPIERAWNRMVTVLFRPFNLGKWMVIGFPAFLANCGRGGGGSGNFNRSLHSGHQAKPHVSFDEMICSLREGAADLWTEHAQLIIWVASALVVFIIVMTILMNWLNSRGQFMFLENVLKNRGAVGEPWAAYKKEANSLMLFQILFGLITSIIGLALLVSICMAVYPMLMIGGIVGGFLAATVGLILLCMVFGLVCSFVTMVLSNFIVPLMYQRRLSVGQGFDAFFPLLKKNFWRFILYGLVLFLVNLVTGMMVLIGVLLTCCTALLLLIIPYIGTVVLLPLFVFRRFIGVEFLRQFGDEYDLIEAALPEQECLPEPS